MEFNRMTIISNGSSTQKCSRLVILIKPNLVKIIRPVFYTIEILIFHNSKDTFFYMLQDLSFVPIQVLLVTFVIHGLMKRREKESFLNKLYMVTSVFYNDMGLNFIKSCNNFIQDITETGRHLTISAK